jgi:alanine dehydrogenase
MGLKGEPLTLSDAEFGELISLETAIDVLASAHRELGAGKADVLPRAHLRWDDDIMHAVGGRLGDEYSGVRTWTLTPRGGQPVLILFSAIDGRIVALIEAGLLGRLRTAATSGLATRLLAREDATTLACLGTGRQALAQIEAVAAVRTLSAVSVWGRDSGRRAEFAQRTAAVTGLDVEPADSIAAAVAEADIVTTVTRSPEPLLDADDLTPGLHINAVGALTAAASEMTPTAVGRCDRVAVDFLPQAREDSGELRDAVAGGELSWDEVVQLGAVEAGTAEGRSDGGQITLMRAMGIGLADVALGAEALRRLQAAEVDGARA